MAVYRNAKLHVDGTDLSSHVRALSLVLGNEELDDTAMGDDTRTSAAGIATWAVTAEFNQTYTTGSGTPDDVFATLVGYDRSASIIVRPGTTTATALSKTNPKYSGTCIVTEYTPQSGSVGDQAISSVSLAAGSTLTRAVAT